MRFIELTNITGKPVLLNTDTIEAVFPEEENSRVVFQSDGYLVQEPYEEVTRKILDKPVGEWIEHKYAEEYDGLMQSNFECNRCHDWLREQTNYCPNCGAKMGGDTENPLGILHPNFRYEMGGDSE